MKPTVRETLRLIREDMEARCRYERKTMSGMQAFKFLFNPPVACIVVYRLQVFCAHWRLRSIGILPLRPIETFLRFVNEMVFMVSLDSNAQIAGGLVVLHSHGVRVGGNVIAGRNLMLFHQNTIGYSPYCADAHVHDAPGRGPVLGDDVVVGAGASIFGPVTIGDGCKIAVNSAVDCDCPPGSVMFGVPARQVSKR